MAVFKEITGGDFMEKYDGKKLFQEFIPKAASIPAFLLKPFYSKKVSEIVGIALKKGYCTQAQLDELEKAFNERYAGK